MTPSEKLDAVRVAECHWGLAAKSGNRVLVFNTPGQHHAPDAAATALAAAGVTSAPQLAEVAGHRQKLMVQTSTITDGYWPSDKLSEDDARKKVIAALEQHLN